MDNEITDLAGSGSTTRLSTIDLMGLCVFLAISDAWTFHWSRCTGTDMPETRKFRNCTTNSRHPRINTSKITTTRRLKLINVINTTSQVSMRWISCREGIERSAKEDNPWRNGVPSLIEVRGDRFSESADNRNVPLLTGERTNRSDWSARLHTFLHN